MNIGSSDFQCLPTAARNVNKGPGNNNFTISENVMALALIFVGLRVFTFFLLSAALKYKKV